MHQNIIISGTGVYVPAHKVYNDYFEQHFRELGIETKGLMEHLGRRKRYFADAGESSLTMGYNAALNALSKISMQPEELDMIVFVSDTPEYTFPTNALKLNHMLKASNAHTVFDMNCNCIGMLTAMDVVSRYMQNKPSIKNALVVGSLFISSIVNKSDSVVYPTFGDGAAALVLKNVSEEEPRGFIDSTVFTDANYHNTIMMPACGMSNMFKDDISKEKKKLEWNPFDFGFLSDNWYSIIVRLLKRHELEPKDVDYYIFSQFSDADNLKTLKKMGVDDEKYIFVGREYGYTGVTSPIIALNRAWSEVAKKGTKVVFCSVAAGYSMVAIYYEF